MTKEENEQFLQIKNKYKQSWLDDLDVDFLINSIEKLQCENRALKEGNAEAWEEWNNLEQGSYETEQKLKQRLKKLQKENEKALAEYMKWQKRELGQKDKIIDLMAETINNHDIDEDICKQMGQKANCNEFEDTEKCKECIKQYFINKAKEI